jgi:hypothetical protein
LARVALDIADLKTARDIWQLSAFDLGKRVEEILNSKAFEDEEAKDVLLLFNGDILVT